jgi:hypothetical protein
MRDRRAILFSGDACARVISMNEEKEASKGEKTIGSERRPDKPTAPPLQLRPQKPYKLLKYSTKISIIARGKIMLAGFLEECFRGAEMKL